MKLSTTTSTFRSDDKGQVITDLECMRRCAAAGFRAIHLSLGRCKNDKKHPLNGDQWEHWVDEVGNLASDLGLEITLAHLPYFGVSDPMYINLDDRAHFQRATLRAIRACGILGIPWGIAHTVQLLEEQCFAPQIKANNFVFQAPFVEAAKKEGLGIAFENMRPDVELESYTRYTMTHWELIDFVDAWNDDAVGACWDFGHANYAYKDQAVPIRAIGKRLKAVHIQDNLGRTEDLHLVPYLGTIDWDLAIQGLVDIDFEGDITLEPAGFCDGRPEEVQSIMAKYSYDIGCYLLNLYEKKKRLRG